MILHRTKIRDEVRDSMTKSSRTRRTVLASTAAVFGGSIAGTGSASESLTASQETTPPYPAGEAPEPDPEWVSDHEDITAEWLEASDEIAPDDEFYWMHNANASELAGVQITYGESVEFAETVIEIAVEDDVDDVTDDVEGADEAYYYAGFGLENHLYVREANAMIDVRAARRGLDGEYESNVATSVVVAEAMLEGIEADRDTAEDDGDDDGWFAV